ncbi:d-lactate dehydrogenase [Colletotrichum karsti]|uniref:D-lactate dehydrogenase n=1 Tax=Colletotrichum karsti TaxID=1095194 RepID=A0A9P6HUZ9_9PEZI|nr:d-lactate dehydrogenase [Colletotrichum karsti]KAF9870919.1 d-lactate dehydrogenase [Colletotrichum karsti]
MGSQAAIEEFLEKHPSIKTFSPSHPDFQSLRQTYIATSAISSFIVRPQSIDDVAALVSHCAATSTPFVVRSGGHDMSARSTVDGILQIDMRDICYVNVSSDKTSARVGGGILNSALLAELERQDLITPTGTVGSVGYVGWASLGGYSSYTPSLGLGVDQILAAKVVLASGELVDADEELLVGIRGAGPALGVIVELEIKVYPKTEIQAGVIFYDSKDIRVTIKTFWTNWRKLLDEKCLPDELCLQPAVIEAPGMGKVFMVGFVWNGPGSDDSNRWLDEISALAPVGMKAVAPTSPMGHLAQISALVPPTVIPGSSHGVSTKSLIFTDDMTELYAEYGARMPGDGALLSTHQLRGKAARSEHLPGVFRWREDHNLLEIVGLTVTKEKSQEGKEWADGLRDGLAKLDGVIEGGYYSLLPKGQFAMEVVYGDHWETVKRLKAKVDPGNVFKFAFGS